MTIILTFYDRGNGGSEMISNLPACQFSELARSRLRILTWVSNFKAHVLDHGVL